MGYCQSLAATAWRIGLPALGSFAIALLSGSVLQAALGAEPVHASSGCKGGNGGLTLSPGFCATIFADNLGHVRHMVAAPDGTLYANTWSGRYFANSPTPPGGFLLALKDTTGSGKADVIRRFGVTVEEGGTGGSGIALYNGALYAEENSRVLRYPLQPGEMIPTAGPTIVVSGLTLVGDHPMHPFIIDPKGRLFLDVGSATNACQIENRIASSPGRSPCTEKKTRAGTWLYDANKSNQVFSPSQRYVSGLRNGEGLAVDAGGRLFATMHGRDQLFQNWPYFYTVDQSAELPAEELVVEERGADYGWPECYYDQKQGKLVLAPEYGGDGGRKLGVCTQRRAPIAAFPGHWAPNDLLIYRGNKFPAGWRGGAFIAFHGSWNRAPDPQQGYDVVFQPLANGKASGSFVVFADGFAGGFKDPGRAAFRPTGLAEAPDGSIYVADDKHGRIWRIDYEGNGSDRVVSAAAATETAKTSQNTLPPEGIHPHAGSLPVPPGATREQVELGDRIFQGKAASGTCSGCHGGDAGGSPQGPPLNSGHWLWSDGSLGGIRHTIETGVPHPKQYQGVMPPLGGAPLTKADLDAVAAYVWSVGHARNQ